MSTEQPTTVTVRVAPRFWDDHIERVETNARVIRETKTGVTVEFTLEALVNFESDVEFYNDRGVGRDLIESLGDSGRRLIASARACRRALDKVGATAIARSPEALDAYRRWEAERQARWAAEREAEKRALIEFARTH